MAKKKIAGMIEDLEYFVENCKVQAFSSNKIVVPRDEMLNMIREIKMKLPSEIEQSNHVMENRDAILAEARKRADDILNSARDDAQRKINESEIMQMATEQARELLIKANEQAKEMIEQAQEDGDAIRIGALHYTNNVMMDLSEFTARFVEEEETKYKLLVDSLKGTLKTIETNRAQITAQLNTGMAPDDDVTIQQKTEVEEEKPKNISEVEKMHSQESRSNRPGFQVPEVGQEPAAAPQPVKRQPEKQPEQPVEKAPTPQPAPVRQEVPMEDELDELDELYLDEFQ